MKLCFVFLLFVVSVFSACNNATFSTQCCDQIKAHQVTFQHCVNASFIWDFVSYQVWIDGIPFSVVLNLPVANFSFPTATCYGHNELSTCLSLYTQYVVGGILTGTYGYTVLNNSAPFYILSVTLSIQIPPGIPIGTYKPTAAAHQIKPFGFTGNVSCIQNMCYSSSPSVVLGQVSILYYSVGSNYTDLWYNVYAQTDAVLSGYSDDTPLCAFLPGKPNMTLLYVLCIQATNFVWGPGVPNLYNCTLSGNLIGTVYQNRQVLETLTFPPFFTNISYISEDYVDRDSLLLSNMQGFGSHPIKITE